MAPPNKPMHPTADSMDFMFFHGVARRVIGSVGRLQHAALFRYCS